MKTSWISRPEDAKLEETILHSIHEQVTSFHAVVRDGYVNLSGEVPDAKIKREIASTVRSVDGVKMVTNHLRISQGSPKGNSPKLPIHF